MGGFVRVNHLYARTVTFQHIDCSFKGGDA